MGEAGLTTALPDSQPEPGCTQAERRLGEEPGRGPGPASRPPAQGHKAEPTFKMQKTKAQSEGEAAPHTPTLQHWLRSNRGNTQPSTSKDRKPRPRGGSPGGSSRQPAPGTAPSRPDPRLQLGHTGWPTAKPPASGTSVLWGLGPAGTEHPCSGAHNPTVLRAGMLDTSDVDIWEEDSRSRVTAGPGADTRQKPRLPWRTPRGVGTWALSSTLRTQPPGCEGSPRAEGMKCSRP